MVIQYNIHLYKSICSLRCGGWPHKKWPSSTAYIYTSICILRCDGWPHHIWPSSTAYIYTSICILRCDGWPHHIWPSSTTYIYTILSVVYAVMDGHIRIGHPVQRTFIQVYLWSRLWWMATSYMAIQYSVHLYVYLYSTLWWMATSYMAIQFSVHLYNSICSLRCDGWPHQKWPSITAYIYTSLSVVYAVMDGHLRNGHPVQRTFIQVYLWSTLWWMATSYMAIQYRVHLYKSICSLRCDGWPYQKWPSCTAYIYTSLSVVYAVMDGHIRNSHRIQ